MTTAHRATWKAARGGLQEEGSFRLHVPSAGVSAKDAPTERVLKTRADADASATRDRLRAALEEGERRAVRPAKRRRFELLSPAGLGLTLNSRGGFAAADGLAGFDADAVLEDDVEERNGVTGTDKEGGTGVDFGNEGDVAKEEEDKEEDESDEDSDDDEAELLAELERIKKEREFEKAKKKAEEQERLEREATAKAATGNPLMPQLSVFNDEISDTASVATGSMPAFDVKRRWDDDVIFRDQAKEERKTAPRFINDTIRNDFHQRFMNKYMR